jgi:hypothetical protein
MNSYHKWISLQNNTIRWPETKRWPMMYITKCFTLPCWLDMLPFLLEFLNILCLNCYRSWGGNICTVICTSSLYVVHYFKYVLYSIYIFLWEARQWKIHFSCFQRPYIHPKLSFSSSLSLSLSQHIHVLTVPITSASGTSSFSLGYYLGLSSKTCTYYVQYSTLTSTYTACLMRLAFDMINNILVNDDMYVLSYGFVVNCELLTFFRTIYLYVY